MTKYEAILFFLFVMIGYVGLILHWRIKDHDKYDIIDNNKGE